MYHRITDLIQSYYETNLVLAFSITLFAIEYNKNVNARSALL